MAASAGGIKAGAEWCLQLRSVTLTRRKWYAQTYLRLGAQAILHSKWRLRRAETAVFGAGCARRGAMIDARPVTATGGVGGTRAQAMAFKCPLVLVSCDLIKLSR